MCVVLVGAQMVSFTVAAVAAAVAAAIFNAAAVAVISKGLRY